ncbi:hypothetical protein JAAARDRAFT_83949, partial [Jaapia argillacea MUCL 33604]
LEGLLERQPDMYLGELQIRLEEVCGVDVSIATIHRTLRRRGLTYKKVTRPAIERDADDRAQYQMLIANHF